MGYEIAIIIGLVVIAFGVYTHKKKASKPTKPKKDESVFTPNIIKNAGTGVSTHIVTQGDEVFGSDRFLGYESYFTSAGSISPTSLNGAAIVTCSYNDRSSGTFDSFWVLISGTSRGQDFFQSAHPEGDAVLLTSNATYSADLGGTGNSSWIWTFSDYASVPAIWDGVGDVRVTFVV